MSLTPGPLLRATLSNGNVSPMPISQSAFDADVKQALVQGAAALGITGLKLTPHSPRKMSCKAVRYLIRRLLSQADDVLVDAHYRWRDKESRSTMRIRYTGDWPRFERLLVTSRLVMLRPGEMDV